MRKRLLACMIAVAMAIQSVPVSASEISHEGETGEASLDVSVEENSIEETSMEKISLEETSTEETSIEETSVKETLTESEATDTTAPEEGKTEESSKEDETQSVEKSQEIQTDSEADSTESASETETIAETETETETTEIETETETTEIESMSEEPLSEIDYEEYPNGVIPFEIRGTDIFAGLNTSLYTTKGIENRAKYDPRIDAPEEMTPVRNQNPWGTCWAHAVMACLENAAIRQGIADNSIDLSERHLAYFSFKTGSDRLGNANDDTMVYDLEEGLNLGGNSLLAAIKLMNWHGAASEEKYPYSRNLNSMAVSQSDAQDMEVMAHDIYFVPNKATKDERITAIKKLIAEYGCVEWSYGNHNDFYNADTSAYYNPKTYSETSKYAEKNAGHAITVVGWDDNFSKENFGNSKAETVYKPSNNGAWIVKNSWGEGWGDSGYFYISYEDVSFGTSGSGSVMVVADKKEYDNNYFYGNTATKGMYATKKAAQVYQVKGGANTEKLKAVSILLGPDKVKYSLQVYKNPKLVGGVVKDPESGTAMLKEPVTGTTGYEGLYTIDLPEPIPFSKGDLMSIVFTFPNSAYICADSSSEHCTNTTHPGQSFRNTGSAWTDYHDSGKNYRINALTKDDVYRVTFLDAWGNPINEQMVDGGKDAVPPTAPDREGYTFKAWSGSYQNITKDTKLTAQYEPITYSIAYELNDGIIDSKNPSSYTIETETIVLTEPVRGGYFFAGWYEQSDCSGAPIANIQKGSVENKTLYAKWEEDAADLAKPVLIPQGGIVEEGQTVVIKAPLGADIYYTLNGTMPTTKNGIKYTSPFTITKDVTVKAVAVRNGESTEVVEASYQYYALRLAFAKDVTDLLKLRSKKLELSQIPETKSEADVTWTTSNKKIVTVSEDGTIAGVAVGTAAITAKTRNSKGDEVTASCQVTVKEANDIASGSYKKIVWYIDSNGKLVVTGTGDFSSSTLPPWYAYRERILSAEINVTGITNTANMFFQCSNLTELDVSGFQTDQVTSMMSMFYNCNSLTKLDLSGFQTDQVTNMRCMFWDCNSLIKLDLSGFKTDQVTDMYGMFCNCNSLTKLDLSDFKTDQVTNMSQMFYSCRSLTKLDVSGFQTDQVTNMYAMFYGCNSLTDLDVSGFQTDQVTNMYAMFYGCNSLTDLNLSSFNLVNVTDVDAMLPTISNLKTIQTPRNLKQSIPLTAKANYTWRKPDGTAITELPQNSSKSILITQKRPALKGNYQNITWEIDENGKLTVSGTGEFSAGTSYDRAPWYQYRSYIQSAEIKVTGMKNASYLFNGCSNLTEVNLNGFKTDQVTTMSCMFYYCNSLTEVNLSGLKTDQVTNMSYMFYNCNSLTKVDLSGLKTDQVTNMSYMFYNCRNLTKVDVSGFKTDQVTNMSYMFYNCRNLTKVHVSGFKTDQLYYMEYMFYDCNELTDLDLSSFDLSKIIGKIDNILPNTSNLQTIRTPRNLKQSVPLTAKTDYVWCKPDWTIITELPQNSSESILITQKRPIGGKYQNIIWEIDEDGKLTVTGTGDFSAGTGYDRAPWYEHREEILSAKIKVTGITNTSYMFYKCSNLTEVDVSGLKTDQVINMNCMFALCNSLTEVDVRGFETSQVTNMSSMFNDCNSLTNLDVSSFKTSQVTNMSNMFSSCRSLTNLDVSDFETSQVTNMSGMFSNCNSLTEIDVSGFQTSQVTNISYMFYDCNSLTNLDVSGFKTSQVTTMRYMFYKCNNLTAVDVSGFETSQVTNVNHMFDGCDELIDLNLGSFDLGKVTETIENMLPNSEHSKLETIQTPYNLKQSVELTSKPNYAWCKPDETIITELPKNSSESIQITQKWSSKGTYQGITWAVDENGKLTVIGTGDFSAGTGYDRAPWYACRKEILSAEIKVTGITNTAYMFNGCSNLTKVDLSGLKTDQVTDMRSMFYGCRSLTEIDVSGFQTDQVTNVSFMFHGCIELTDLNLGSFDLGNVTETINNMIPNSSKLETIQTPRNLKRSIELPASDDKTWYQEDGTTLIRLPQNLEQSILITKKEKRIYKISFDLQGHGTQIAEIEVKEGNKISEPPKPEAEGYNFTGWYKEADCKTLWNFRSDTVAADTTLYAGWEEKKPEPDEKVYKVTFDLQGHGTEIAPIEVKEGDKISEPPKPEADGYNFTGWYKEADCKTLWNFEKDTVGADTTLYAGWEEIKTKPEPSEKVYKVTFDLKGHGTEIAPIEVKKGDKISEPPKPEADGYSFMGWYKEAGCRTLWNFEKDTVSKNTTLYAGWKKTGDSENSYEPPEDIPDGIWIAPIRNYTYTGRAITPVVHVYYNKQKLILGRDYTITYRNNTKAAGEWEKKAPQVCVKGKGNYSGTAKRSFTIEKALLTNENLKAAEVYDAKIKYTPIVALDGNPLKAGTDYTLIYSNANGMILKKQPTTIGSYQMCIIGKGNCEGQIDFSYRIDVQGGAATIDKGTAIVDDMIYDGAEPQVTLTVGGRPLKRNTDYMVSFSNINKKGTATATFIGIGSYAGTLKKNFKVQAAPIQWKDVAIDENVMYEKGGAKPKPAVTVNGTELVVGKDYTVTYKNNTKIGIATVTVKGKGNFTGSLTEAFRVEPKSLTAEGVKIYVSDVMYGKKPTVIVYDSNGKKLSVNSDYMVYLNQAAHNVSIIGGNNGLYKTQDPIVIEYRELEKDRLVSSVTLNKKAFGFPKYFEYTGKEVELEKDWLTVKAGKTVLNNDAFEILGYVNNIEKGTASVIIQGTEGYGGVKVLNFKIKAKGLF